MHQFAKALRFMNADVEWIIEWINCCARLSFDTSRIDNFSIFAKTIVASFQAQSPYLERQFYPKFATYLSC